MVVVNGLLVATVFQDQTHNFGSGLLQYEKAIIIKTKKHGVRRKQRQAEEIRKSKCKVLKYPEFAPVSERTTVGGTERIAAGQN